MFSLPNASSLSQSIGYSRAKTFEFRKIKDEKIRKGTRFRKNVGSNSSIDSPLTSQKLLNTSAGEAAIEMGGVGVAALPPAWVDVYEEAQEKLKKIRIVYREIQKLIASKVKLQFGNQADLDAQINRKNGQATKLLQECEGYLTTISKMKTTGETNAQEKIRTNTERVLATQIQEVAVLLRRQQKGLLDRVKEVDGIGAASELNVEVNDEMYTQELQDMILADDIAQERDEDINILIDNINKLNQLFRDMNQIVLEQGTIVDRIDYNLEQALDNTVKGKKQLVKANVAMNSKCGTNCIKILIMLNMIFSVLLFIKFSHKG